MNYGRSGEGVGPAPEQLDLDLSGRAALNSRYVVVIVNGLNDEDVAKLNAIASGLTAAEAN